MNIDMHKDGNKNREVNPMVDSNTDENFTPTGASAADESLSDEGADVQSERIRLLEEELQDTKDRFLRNLAEMDNMRRRQERERQDLLKYASEKLLQDLLPVLDSFEKASSAGGVDAGNAVIEGIRMVHKQLVTVLENNGLKPVAATGKPFDPNFHQAIQKVEVDDVEQETVKDEFQRGYLLNGRLIRPSMVSVLVPKSGSSDSI
jgi:molecular chaperone GrpE